MPVSRPLASAMLLIQVLLIGRPPTADAQVSIFRVQALNDSGVREGTCFVIRQETRTEGTFLVLVTSARLFERESRRRALVHIAGRDRWRCDHDALRQPA